VKLLEQLAAIAAGTGSRRERASAIAARIVTTTGARWVGIYSVTDETVVNEAWHGPAAPAHPRFPVTAGLTSYCIRTKSVAVSNDVAADPRYLTNQTDSGSELIVPIVVDDRVVGTLDVESDGIGAFDGELIALFQRVASSLAPLWAS
jgi:L-methionine (R)-S-oxide reductase